MAITSPSSFSNSTVTPGRLASRRSWRPLRVGIEVHLTLHVSTCRKNTFSCKLLIVVLRVMMSESDVFSICGNCRPEKIFSYQIAIAVAEPLELIGDDRADRFADRRTRHVVLGQAADPEVDVVDVAVELLERLLNLWVGADLGETS